MFGGFLVFSLTILLHGKYGRLVTDFPFAASRYSSNAETGEYFFTKANGTRNEISEHTFQRGVLDERLKQTAGNVATISFFAALVGVFYPDISKRLSKSETHARTAQKRLDSLASHGS